jgi:predicted RNase H-like nuclease (RuvC/YqgF family)
MPENEDARWIRAEIETLRRELADMHREQKELAHTVEQMNHTFRSLALQLGIAAEPYRKKTESDRGRDLPGFG